MARRTSYITTTVDDSVRESLKSIGDLILDIYRDKVPVKTGALRRSLSYRILVNGGVYSLSLGYLFYGTFQDLGVNGTLRNRNSPYSFNSTTIGGTLPFAVRKSIAEQGLRAKNWTELNEQDREQINADIEFLFGQTLDELFPVIFETLETTSAGTQPRTRTA
jgi:hypothetical protein